MKKPKKCFLGRHEWKNKSLQGIFAASFLDRCEKCRWWKVWGVSMAGSYSKLYHPGFFYGLKNTQTGEVAYISLPHMLEKLNHIYTPKQQKELEEKTDREIFKLFTTELNKGSFTKKEKR